MARTHATLPEEQGKVIVRGSATADEMKLIQSLLVDLKQKGTDETYLPGNPGGFSERDTFKAVWDFQKDYGFSATGRLDYKTAIALNKAVKKADNDHNAKEAAASAALQSAKLAVSSSAPIASSAAPAQAGNNASHVAAIMVAIEAGKHAAETIRWPQRITLKISPVASSIIEHTSGWDPYSVTSKGEIGLMGLKPDIAQQMAAELGIEYNHRMLVDPEKNVALGQKYLEQLHEHYAGDLRLMLAAYKHGAAHIDKLLALHANPNHGAANG